MLPLVFGAADEPEAESGTLCLCYAARRRLAGPAFFTSMSISSSTDVLYCYDDCLSVDRIFLPSLVCVRFFFFSVTWLATALVESMDSTGI